MHHQDRDIHTVGFRFPPQSAPIRRRTFDACPWIAAAAVIMALAIAARYFIGA